MTRTLANIFIIILAVIRINHGESLDKIQDNKIEQNILKLQEQLIESIDTKLLLKMDESNAIIVKTWKKIEEENANLKNNIDTLKQELIAALSEMKELIRAKRSNPEEVDIIENSLNKQDRKLTEQEKSLQEIKELIKDNRYSAANESLALKQELQELVQVLKAEEVSSCADVDDESGVYRLNLHKSGLKPFAAYCLLDPENSTAWTIVQRRVDNSTDFYRDWMQYKQGFGNVSGNFWIGLDNLHALTHKQPHELWILLEDFEGQKRSANYSTFSIENEQNKYKLIIDDYKGDAGDAMALHNGKNFSTFDVDSKVDCAGFYKGAWWYDECHNSHLNGEYLLGMHEELGHGITWNHWHGNEYSLKYVHMAIRPKARKQSK